MSPVCSRMCTMGEETTRRRFFRFITFLFRLGVASGKEKGPITSDGKQLFHILFSWMGLGKGSRSHEPPYVNPQQTFVSIAYSIVRQTHKLPRVRYNVFQLFGASVTRSHRGVGAAAGKPKATGTLHTRIIRVVRVLYTLFFIFMLFSSSPPLHVLIVHISSETHDLYHETPVVYTFRSAATVIHTGEYGGLLCVLISQPPAVRYTD